MANIPHPPPLRSGMTLGDSAGVTAAVSCAVCGQPVQAGIVHLCPVAQEKTDGSKQ